MIQIPTIVQERRAYKPGKILHKDPKITILNSNENNFGTSPLAIQAIQKELIHLNRYPDVAAQTLKAKLAKKLNIDVTNIAVGHGADALLYNSCKAYFDEGDELLTSQCTFFSFLWNAAAHKIPIHQVPTTPEYGFDLDAIYQAINEKTKVIYLCNANNPTGAIILKDALVSFLNKIPKHILVIVDEAYYEFSSVYSPEYPDSIALAYDNVITMRTFSKAYGLAGLRLGYAVGAPYLIEALDKVRLPFEPSIPAQAAGTAALDDDDFLNNTIEQTKIGLEYYQHRFDNLGIPYIPSYANFVTIQMESKEAASNLCQHLAEHQIMVRQLFPFDMPQFIRISVGKMEENKRLVAGIEAFQVSKV